MYLDSSALVKRVRDEESAGALRTFLSSAVSEGVELYTSALAAVEVSRAIRTALETVDPRMTVSWVESALAGVDQVQLSDPVISLARRIGPSSLRSLDAIHLACATLVSADAVIGYDERMQRAAAELGFAASTPR